VIECGRSHLLGVIDASKNVIGTRILSLTPTEQTKLRDTKKKQKRQYKIKKKNREVERKKETLNNLVHGPLFADWSSQDII
jgi:hypothetical protein